MKELDKIRREAFYWDDETARYEPVLDAVVVAQHQERGVDLMREAIDLPFMPDKAAWDAWCKSWAERAEKWIAEAKA